MRKLIAIAYGALLTSAAVAAALLAGCGSDGHSHFTAPAASRSPSVVLSQPLPAAPAALAARINLAQRAIDERSSPNGELAHAGADEQLATLVLQRETIKVRRTTLADLGGQAADTTRSDLNGDAALSGLGRPQAHLPHWRIIQPPAPTTLLGYFQAAQARFGVAWEDLAAIELIETDFGRVEGVSSAGAQGPMQFLPATWTRYGSGPVWNQRDAILGAARFLRAKGAPADVRGALYRYNDNSGYVRAVEDYAGRMQADPRTYYGYYYWQVIYDRVGGPVILPVGYPRARAQPLAVGP